MTWATKLRTSSRVPLLQAVKTSVATVLAWVVAGTLLPGQLPIFAAVAALLVVQPSVNQSFGKAIERTFGVVLGVLVATGISLLFGQNSWVVLLAIVVSIMMAWLLRLNPGSSNQIPISAMLVLALGAATPDYAFTRIIETIIGAVIALIVNLVIVPPVLLLPAHHAVARLAAGVASVLDQLAVALSTPMTNDQLMSLMHDSRSLRDLRDTADQRVTEGEESLTLNPRRSAHRDRLVAASQLLTRLTPLVTRVIGMSRALRDHYDEQLSSDPAAQAIATELTRAAHDLRLLIRPIDSVDIDLPTVTSEMPALTAPLVILKPNPEHWILLGSLMEDLRRVREEIVGE
ncbi:aromatic acid exporter family protein [Homoserinimonas sp. OAct 916]|uniref:FUSC family protein n=1 Tax=Homoserinimonas sp. OAct 916 TaxID=2211450 RepID=UPI000DBE7BFA|nr:FUSC family protein [Homoserinimonas sp. OAct 916]